MEESRPTMSYESAMVAQCDGSSLQYSGANIQQHITSTVMLYMLLTSRRCTMSLHLDRDRQRDEIINDYAKYDSQRQIRLEQVGPGQCNHSPQLLDVCLELNAHRSVVIEPRHGAIYLGGLEHEALSLAEINNVIQLILFVGDRLVDCTTDSTSSSTGITFDNNIISTSRRERLNPSATSSIYSAPQDAYSREIEVALQRSVDCYSSHPLHDE